MRGSAKKLKEISYDYRWFARHEWIRPYHLLYHIRKFNTKLLKTKNRDFFVHTGRDTLNFLERFEKVK
jgi:hypothetical protein